MAQILPPSFLFFFFLFPHASLPTTLRAVAATFSSCPGVERKLCRGPEPDQGYLLPAVPWESVCGSVDEHVGVILFFSPPSGYLIGCWLISDVPKRNCFCFDFAPFCLPDTTPLFCCFIVFPHCFHLSWSTILVLPLHIRGPLSTVMLLRPGREGGGDPTILYGVRTCYKQGSWLLLW